jgi:flagellar biosynthesis protein FliQ
MTVDFAVQLLSQALLAAIWISMPILLLILLIGLLVNVAQVVTQLQEMTLSFIPKIVALVILLTLAGPWMLSKLSEFALRMFTSVGSIH